MTKIKLCGLTREADIQAVNEIRPEFIGFVFAKKSKRYTSKERARQLKAMLDKEIKAVGVFVNEDMDTVCELLEENIIDIPQLHGSESDDYIVELKKRTGKPVIKAIRIDSEEDIERAKVSKADYVLLDSGNGGTGTSFDWELIKKLNREYFLAGGLGLHNIREAVSLLKPFAVDVSSGIETEGLKDKNKMTEFAAIVRKGDQL